MPAIHPIVAAHAKLDFIARLALQSALPLGADAGQVGRMHQLRPVIAQQVIFVQARIVNDLLVDPVQFSLGCGRPDLIGHGLRQHPKARFALLQRYLGELALCHVLHHAAHPDGRAAVIAHKFSAPCNPAYVPGICFFDAVLDIEQRIAALAAGMGGNHMQITAHHKRFDSAGRHSGRNRQPEELEKFV